MNKTKIVLLIAALLILAGGGAFYLFSQGYISFGPVTYDALVKRNANFAKAVDLIRNGGDKDQARQLLQSEITKAEAAKQYNVAGIMKLNYALTINSNNDNIDQLTLYNGTLASVATNPDYDARTKQYAVAFMGELFARMLSMRDPVYNKVMDVSINNPGFASSRVTNPDGTPNYHASIIAILRLAKDKNPLVNARLASFLTAGLSAEHTDQENQDAVKEAVALIDQAKSNESDLQQEDTTSLYSGYVFLTAQALGNAAVYAHGKYASLITENVDDLYEKAVTASIAGSNRGIESSVRYNYAKYLMLKYTNGASHTAAENTALSSKLEELLKPLEANEAVRNTPQVTVILAAVHNKNTYPDQYALIEQIASRAPSFKKLIGS